MPAPLNPRLNLPKGIRDIVRQSSKGGTTVMGGMALIPGAQHALAGSEHTGQLPVERLSTDETDTTLVLAPDGAGGVEFREGTLANPMTAQDDLIVGGAVTGGVAAAARLGKGTDGKMLIVDPTTHHIVWSDLLTVHSGSPVGGGYLSPLVFDSTATTGGLYYWTGSDYAVAVKTT